MNLLISVLFSCSAIAPLPKGTPAPCDGILWTVDASKQALACRQVIVPSLEAECLALEQELASVYEEQGKQISALDDQVLSLEQEIVELKKPTPWFLSSKLWIPVSFAAGVSLGVYLGGI